VGSLARRRRRDHQRFQKLWAGRPAAPTARVHLNPLRAWARFVTPALLGGQATPPQDVLFFARGESVVAAAVEAKARALVRLLAASGPRTPAALCRTCPLWERGDLVQQCRDLAEIGLAAFGS
jgi:hypothetical protein